MGSNRRGSATGPLVALVILAAVGLSGCQAILDSRSTMTVDDVAAGFKETEGLPFTNARTVTDELCTGDVRCEAALRADEVTIYQFDDRDDAARLAEKLGADGIQSDWIVLEYPGASADTGTQELSYASLVHGMWTSD